MLSTTHRPFKRRRIDHGATEPSIENIEASREPSIYSGSEADEYDLPAYGKGYGDDHVEDSCAPGNIQQASRPKRSIDITAACYQPPEDTFVTQTQPRSSPSRIRGPRWRRKSSNPTPSSPMPAATPAISIPQAQTAETPSGANGTHHFEEDELVLAAALSSSDGFGDESDQQPHTRRGLTTADGSEKTSSVSLPRSIASFRQTTLFGHSESREDPSASQMRTHNWPLISKAELPTHHKLNYDAAKTWVYPTNLGKIRDYQFNIVQRGLFHNLLVALPTGLGKTFIAATVMLNWFRWTVDAQIVFVAPTKPLVSQQVEACFGIVGIPRSETTMLTGNVQPALRAQEWQSKRVFFMTPQTLIHDLKTGICDPKKLVLLVVDEAHRATGNYAYVEVVRFLRRFNSSFRVLALTATPGASVEAVQDVIDGLDIARVEIRTEESLDIRQFVHTRNIDIETFESSEELSMSLDLFSKALQPVLNQLVGLNAYWGRDPSNLTPFGLTKARQQWMGSDAAKKGGFSLKGRANALFSVLASLAHAIVLLKFHGIGSFYRNLLNFSTSISDGTNNGKYAKQIANDEHFKKLMHRLHGWVDNADFVGHPKLSYLKTVVLNHFLDAGEGHGVAGGRPPSDTRIMIFVHYRDSAEEVTRVLSRHQPMIRPHVFVGQTGAKASDGMDQKTQLAVIEKFKKGIYNTIVATSIGEEGLDIGEVDLIVCYDSSASPIRMLQRMGRTGRKRAGNIVLLLMKGKEEDSFTKAKDNYEKMQQMIADGSRFTFHDDRSPRIIPKEIISVADKRKVDIPGENSQSELPEPRKRGKVAKKPPKKFHMPDGVQTGFIQASLIDGKPAQTDKEQKEVLDVDVAPLPALESVLLSNDEEVELDQRYCNVGGGTPQYIQQPRFGAFLKSQRKPRPTSHVGHSRLTAKLVKCLAIIQHPLDHTLEFGALADSEEGLLILSRPGTGDRSSQPRAAGSSPLSGGPATITTAAKQTISSQGKGSAAASSAMTERHRCLPPAAALSPSPNKVGCSQLCEEQPFYISQQSHCQTNGSDDDLPEVGSLVPATKAARDTAIPAGKLSPPMATQRQRRRVQRVLDDSDDE